MQHGEVGPLLYSTKMAFNSVIVVQSLGEDESPRGTKLFDGTVAPAARRDEQLAELYEPTTAAEFIRVLKHVAKLCEEHRLAPVLHLEAHGGHEGIKAADSDVVPWRSLAPILTRINTASHMNLLVVAAMCHGIHMSEVLSVVDRSPAFAVIGAESTMDPDDLLDVMRLLLRPAPQHRP